MDNMEKARALISNCENLERLIARQDKLMTEAKAQLREIQQLRRDWQSTLLDNSLDLPAAMLKHERELIATALRKIPSKSLVQAALLLGISHQSLTYMINTRHRSLLELRSPIKPRARRPPQEGARP